MAKATLRYDCRPGGFSGELRRQLASFATFKSFDASLHVVSYFWALTTFATRGSE